MARKLRIDPGIIAAILGLIPAIFKHKPFCLWYCTDEGKWVMKGGPFSSRQCRKTRGELVRIGFKEERFAILRKGVTPDQLRLTVSMTGDYQ